MDLNRFLPVGKKLQVPNYLTPRDSSYQTIIALRSTQKHYADQKYIKTSALWARRFLVYILYFSAISYIFSNHSSPRAINSSCLVSEPFGDLLCKMPDASCKTSPISTSAL